jgi:hypothetical protein
MIFVLFFIVAVAYSSVGFGGGSSYLALLTLWAMPYEEIRILALLCNIAVVSWNIWMHRRTKNLDLKAALQFVVLSVPSAFLHVQNTARRQRIFHHSRCCTPFRLVCFWCLIQFLRVSRSRKKR